MQLNMRTIISGGRSQSIDGMIDLADLVRSNSNLAEASPAQVEATAQAEDSTVVVDGQVQSELTYICSRCLKHFTNQLAFPFEEVFSYEPVDEQEEEDDRFVHIVDGDRVDLAPYIEGLIMMEMPQFPLCDEHCRGLCPHCGCDRNTESCSCESEQTDPRWNGLKNLFLNR